MKFWLLTPLALVLCGAGDFPERAFFLDGEVHYESLPKETIRSVTLRDGCLIVVRTIKSWPTSTPPAPADKAIRSTYCAEKGQIVLEWEETGRYFPERTEPVPERYEWQE